MEGTGKVTYFYEGQTVGSAEVTLTPEYVKEQTGYDITPQITKKGSAQADTPKEEVGLSFPVKILIGAGAALVVLAAIFCAVVRYMLVKKRRRRLALARRRRKGRSVNTGEPVRRYSHSGSPYRAATSRGSNHRRSVRRSAESPSRYVRGAVSHPSVRKRRR